jgi:hypothetical protein
LVARDKNGKCISICKMTEISVLLKHFLNYNMQDSRVIQKLVHRARNKLFCVSFTRKLYNIKFKYIPRY